VQPAISKAADNAARLITVEIFSIELELLQQLRRGIGRYLTMELTI
jgi:hypothetical protein